MEKIQEGFVEDFIPLPGQYDINEYRNYAYEQIARNWCEKFGLEIEE